MTHRLDGARLKVVRAQQHLQSLDEEVGRYLQRKPYHVVTERDGDLTVARVVVGEEPSPLLGCIVGDCITNIRASLDYIAWEIAMKYSTRQLTKQEARQVQFPILGTKDSKAVFDRHQHVTHLQNVCNVPTSTTDIIESIQPYHAGYEVLNSINVLVNHDKHRAILLCIGGIHESGKITIRQGSRLWTNAGGTAIGVNLNAPRPGLPDAPPVEVKMEGEPSVLITFKDAPMPNEIVGFLLANGIKCVADIIPRFDQFFP